MEQLHCRVVSFWHFFRLFFLHITCSCQSQHWIQERGKIKLLSSPALPKIHSRYSVASLDHCFVLPPVVHEELNHRHIL
uniref:Ferritin n=1 Tax=Rhizophora mucronata TaxID=61149 RepID=A0A2P2KC14_RHIMU